MFGVELVSEYLSVTCILVIGVITLLYWFLTRNHDFWKKRGVPYPRPLPVFGNMLDLFKKPAHEIDMERYNKFGTLYGTFEGSTPVLFVSDPKLIRDVFVKDFAAFPARRFIETGETMFDNMLSVVNGDDWKRIRTIVTPTFTTGKIKRKRNDFLQLLLDTVKDEDQDKEEINPNKENDQDLASNYGQEDVGQQIYKNVTSKDLSLDELVAQCILFFIAGSENTSFSLTFVTYALAINPDCRDRLRKEVDMAIQNADGELTYEALQDMKYLDNVISETFRLYQPGLRLERKAETDYQLGDTGVTVRKGMLISVPVYALHRDPSIFPNPDKFDPDRFTPEKRAERDPYAYVPFGAGPRNCVAMRFALMQIKICIAHVIAHFNIEKGLETKIPLEFKFSKGLYLPKDVIVDLQLRDDCPIKK